MIDATSLTYAAAHGARTLTFGTCFALRRGTCSVGRMRARTWWFSPIVMIGLFLGSCSFDYPADVGDDDAGVGDATAPDAPPLDCEPDTIVCDDASDRYVDCGSDGSAELVIDCPLGCSDSVEKCVDVDPSNGLATYLDMAASGPDVAFAGSSTIDGATVLNGATSIEVPNFVVGGVRVFVFRSLSVAGTLRITGDEPVAFVVDGDVTLTGTVDLSANGWMPGAGGIAGYDGVSDSCNGGSYSGGSPSPGAGGGGHYQTGGIGGSTTVTGGSSGGAGHGASELQPLRSGCAGGTTEETERVYGGGGGGGFQITSRTSVSVTGNAVIDASGGGATLATSGTIACGGGGGGSGGSILLEAPQVVLDGAGVVVSTKGGGGSAVKTSGTTWPGQDGGTGAGAASGGTNGSLPAGGAGGTETLAPAEGGDAAVSGQDGGGAGGSVGRARFNTTAGTINPQQGAAIRSRFTTGTLRTRLVP